MKNKQDIYKPLNKYEKDLKNAIESIDTYKRPKNYKMLLASAIIAANNTSSKSKSINIRVAEKDLIKLKEKSLSTGVPYQTTINSLIRQYTTGKVNLKI